MAISTFAADAFGDPFDITQLPLARPPAGYAVQMLDTDKVLDRRTKTFLSVRSPTLDGLFDSFDDAYRAACHWVNDSDTIKDEHALAIVPASFDKLLSRHVLIYGVLCGQP
jgi:hypothetical protein